MSEMVLGAQLQVSHRGRFSASEREERRCGYSADDTSELVALS